MPNVELIGFVNSYGSKLEQKIWKRAKRLKPPFLNDMVVTVNFGSATHDCHGKRRPFVRLWATDKDEAKEVLAMLKSLNYSMEVEVVELKDFVCFDRRRKLPKKKHKK